MQLSAPRQMLFALILLIHFLLISALAVFSLSNHAAKTRQDQGNMLLQQLNQALADTVAVKDSVGLSLVAGRYTDLPQVNSLKVTSEDGDVLSDIGNAPKLAGEVFSGDITKDSDTIGKVTLTLKTTGLGETVKNQWPLFVGGALLHALLFLLYRLVARQYVVRESVPERAYSGSAAAKAHSVKSSQLAFEADNQALGTVPAQELGEEDFIPKENIFSNTPLADIPNYDDMAVADTPAQTELAKDANRMRLNIQFDDPRSLLPRLAMSVAKPYYKLCDKLLDSAIAALADSSIMPKGVSFDKVNFSVAGVSVVALSENKETAAFSCFLLGQLYLLLHDFTYQKHREINRFALPCKACICNGNVIDSLINLLALESIANDILLLLTPEENVLFRGKVQMQSFSNPKTVLQRDIGVVEEVDHQLIKQISQLRDLVLSK